MLKVESKVGEVFQITEKSIEIATWNDVTGECIIILCYTHQCTLQKYIFCVLEWYAEDIIIFKEAVTVIIC